MQLYICLMLMVRLIIEYRLMRIYIKYTKRTSDKIKMLNIENGTVILLLCIGFRGSNNGVLGFEKLIIFVCKPGILD